MWKRKGKDDSWLPGFGLGSSERWKDSWQIRRGGTGARGGGDWHWVRDQERQLLQIQKEIPVGSWVSRSLTWKYKADDQYGSQGGEGRGVMHPDTGWGQESAIRRDGWGVRVAGKGGFFFLRSSKQQCVFMPIWKISREGKTNDAWEKGGKVSESLLETWSKALDESRETITEGKSEDLGKKWVTGIRRKEEVWSHLFQAEIEWEESGNVSNGQAAFQAPPENVGVQSLSCVWLLRPHGL